MVSSCFASSFSQKYANGVGGVHIFALKIIIFRQSCENTIFTKSAPLSARLTVFDDSIETCSKKSQKHEVFWWFILKRLETSCPNLDRSLRDLGVNAALSQKKAPLCSRLLVFLKSLPSRARRQRVLRVFWALLKMSATLQPFACLALAGCSWADLAAMEA